MPKDQPVALEVSEREVVFAGRIWDVVRETFHYQGEQLKREFVKHTGAVAVLAINEANEILLIKQYRHPVREYLWEIPAGLLDQPGESKLEAAKRELLEETGYIANAWDELIAFHTTPGGNDETIEIFIAKDLRHQGYDQPLEGEEVDLEITWVPFREALTSVLVGDMKNPSAVVGIMAAALKLGITA
jgi:ADP-ribose pyrophosphatase